MILPVYACRKKAGTHSAGPDELAGLNREWTAYHAVLRRKYEHAAGRRWSFLRYPPAHPYPRAPGHGGPPATGGGRVLSAAGTGSYTQSKATRIVGT
jgi:hypothetical protein